jgi:nucleotide-binding universal stress UspA family protein
MDAKIKLLVPIDFSEESIFGLRTALDIAKTTNGSIQLLHVIDEPRGTDFHIGGDMTANEKSYQENYRYTAELIARQRERLRGLAIEYHNPNVPVDIAVESGLYKKGLEEYLENHKIDMIVMGTTGETSVSEFFTGNHAEQALKVSEVPVLAVQQYHSPLRFNKLLLGVDLKKYDQRPVRLIKKVARLLNMKLLVTHIKQDKDAVVDNILDQLNNFVDEHGITDYKLIVADKGKVPDMLQKVAREHDADVIATISEGETGIIRLLFGSKTEDLMESTEKPVLAVRE